VSTATEESSEEEEEEEDGARRFPIRKHSFASLLCSRLQMAKGFACCHASTIGDSGAIVFADESEEEDSEEDTPKKV
jgi:hypothetical protein